MAKNKNFWSFSPNTENYSQVVSTLALYSGGLWFKPRLREQLSFLIELFP
jgi:hypothetical protein